MDNEEYFFAPILTFKVSCFSVLPLQTIPRCFAVLSWEMTNFLCSITLGVAVDI